MPVSTTIMHHTETSLTTHTTIATSLKTLGQLEPSPKIASRTASISSDEISEVGRMSFTSSKVTYPRRFPITHAQSQHCVVAPVARGIVQAQVFSCPEAFGSPNTD